MEMEKMEALANAMQEINPKLSQLNSVLIGDEQRSNKTTLEQLISALTMHTEVMNEQNRLMGLYIQAMESHAAALRMSVEAMEKHQGALFLHNENMADHGRAMSGHNQAMYEHHNTMDRHISALMYR